MFNNVSMLFPLGSCYLNLLSIWLFKATASSAFGMEGTAIIWLSSPSSVVSVGLVSNILYGYWNKTCHSLASVLKTPFKILHNEDNIIYWYIVYSMKTFLNFTNRLGTTNFRLYTHETTNQTIFSCSFLSQPVILKRADITFKHVRSVPNPYTSLYFTVPRPVTAISFG